MSDLSQLARRMKELDDELINCMKCGMCQAVCPVFTETGMETDVARGKISLLDGLADEILKNPEAVSERLNNCLLCGSCQANCPSGVNVVDIFLRARAVLAAYQGLPAAKKAIFRGLLANPSLFNRVAKFGARFQGVFTRKVDEVLGASCARMPFPLLGNRHFPGLASRPLSDLKGPVDTGRGSRDMRVGIFIGCAIDKIFPRVGEAVIKVLKHHGVGIYMPEGQACCGIPVLASGDMDVFQDLVSRNLEVLGAGEVDYLVTACATCTSTIREVWPTLYETNDVKLDRLKNLSEKVMDISAFLVDVLGVQAGDIPAGNGDEKKAAMRVTCHDPCHLRNNGNITRQPRTILQASASTEFVEMSDAGSCCGCGGSFSIDHYDTSSEIGFRKAESIRDTGANIAATSCPACMLQLIDMLSRSGVKNVEVKHPVEVYAGSLI